MKKKLPLFLMFGLVGLALSVMFMVSISLAETDSDPASGPISNANVERIERDIIFDYKIPSETEIAQAKNRVMEASEYQAEVARLGAQQAEKNLDEKIQADIAYYKEMNQKGSEKIQLVKVEVETVPASIEMFPKEHDVSGYGGEAWFTPWTYEADALGNCQLNASDPINLFFWNYGNSNDVRYYLNNVGGWADTEWPAAGNQCAWTGNSDPGTLYTSSLRQQTNQLVQGNVLSRHHLRLWYAPPANGWGYWSVANTHLENWSWTNRTHCVETYDGSESYVLNGSWWAGVKGNVFWFDSQNGPLSIGPKGCGEYVYNDGWIPQIELAVDSPW